MHLVTKEFVFYHDGVTPTTYVLGEHELPQDAADVAVSLGWAVELTEEKPAPAEIVTDKRRGGKK